MEKIKYRQTRSAILRVRGKKALNLPWSTKSQRAGSSEVCTSSLNQRGIYAKKAKFKCYMFGVINGVSTEGMDEREGRVWNEPISALFYIRNGKKLNRWISNECLFFCLWEGVCSSITSISEKWINVLVVAGYTQEEAGGMKGATEDGEGKDRERWKTRGWEKRKKIREVNEGEAARRGSWIESNLCLQTSNPSPWKKSSLDATFPPTLTPHPPILSLLILNI